ncbi:MAG: transporter [Desulfobacterales bacterium]
MASMNISYSAYKMLAFLLAFAATAAQAQEIEPRSFSNAPVGVNFLIASYLYAKGGLAVDPSVPVTNADVQTNAAVLAYARSMNVWGRSGKFSVIVPYAWISGTAELAGQPQQRDISGLGDARFRFSVNFFGAPALSLKEFASYRQDTIIGASLELSVPTGQYDPNKLVNNGTNRWSIKPELGISKAWGPLTAELSAAARIFSDNRDFLNGSTREQDPIYSLQGHLIYALRSGIWLAVDGTYFTGGQTTVDGISNDDLLRNTRLGVTLALPVNRYNSVKLYASTGVATRTGGDYDLIGIAWQVRWGGGL